MHLSQNGNSNAGQDHQLHLDLPDECEWVLATRPDRASAAAEVRALALS